MALADGLLETKDGLKYLPAPQQAAFLGLLRASSELTHAIDGELSRTHNLSLSAYELVSRLAHAEAGHLRMSELAAETGLSLSRVSRLVDQLEGRGLIARAACPGDSRVVHVTILEAGRELLREAQETFFGVVDDRFLGRLSCDEVETLGALLGRLHARGPGRDTDVCPGPPSGADA